MQIILSALKAEAIPLINYYKLLPNNSIGLHMYKNDLFTILITGVGKKNVNKTLKEYLKKSKNIEEAKFINIGIAGGVKGNCKIGEIFFINKVFDDYLEVDYNIKTVNIPNILENRLTTVFEPILNNGQEREGLVDMEAYEICSVLSDFNQLNKLTIIKIVSDFMDSDTKYLSSKQIQKLIEKKLFDIDIFLKDNSKLYK
jgi:nucleoside phosphorylase